MRVDDEIKYQIDLPLIDGVVIAKKLLIHFSTAKAVFCAKKKELEKIDLLSDNEMHLDAIVESLSWGFSKVANELLQAEFKGIILSLPGKIYKKNI